MACAAESEAVRRDTADDRDVVRGVSVEGAAESTTRAFPANRQWPGSRVARSHDDPALLRRFTERPQRGPEGIPAGRPRRIAAAQDLLRRTQSGAGRRLAPRRNEIAATTILTSSPLHHV